MGTVVFRKHQTWRKLETYWRPFSATDWYGFNIRESTYMILAFFAKPWYHLMYSLTAYLYWKYLWHYRAGDVDTTYFPRKHSSVTERLHNFSMFLWWTSCMEFTVRLIGNSKLPVAVNVSAKRQADIFTCHNIKSTGVTEILMMAGLKCAHPAAPWNWSS